VGVVRRGPAAYFSISSRIREAEWRFARQTIEEELAAARGAGLSDSAFAAGRDAIALQFRVQHASADALSERIWLHFHGRELHQDMPDLVTALETATREDLARAAAELTVREREFLRVTYPQPVSQGVLAVLAGLLVAGTVGALRRLMVRPADMTRIRYVARIRPPWLIKLTGSVLWLLAVLVGLRLLVWVHMSLTGSLLLGINSWPAQWGAFALMAASLVALLVLCGSRVPRKLLVFDDHARIKYLSYRALRFRDVWLGRRAFRCAPLALGLLEPGVYLRRRDGRAWFFRVKDRDQCLAALRGALLPGAQPPPPPRPVDATAASPG
jgi:hypothetical protein